MNDLWFQLFNFVFDVAVGFGGPNHFAQILDLLKKSKGVYLAIMTLIKTHIMSEIF